MSVLQTNLNLLFYVDGLFDIHTRIYVFSGCTKKTYAQDYYSL